MKKLLATVIVLMCLTATAFAGVSLYSTVGVAGNGGGLRLDLAPNLFIQGGATGAADVDGKVGSTYQGVVDVVYGNLGLGLEIVGPDAPADITAKFLIEKPLTSSIEVGIAATVLKYDNEPVDGRELKIVPDISAYIVIPL